MSLTLNAFNASSLKLSFFKHEFLKLVLVKTVLVKKMLIKTVPIKKIFPFGVLNLAVLMSALFTSSLVWASATDEKLRPIARSDAQTSPPKSDGGIEGLTILPFAFYSDTTEFAVGVGGIKTSAFQEDASIFGGGFISGNDSRLLYLGAHNYVFGRFDRWLMHVDLFKARFTEAEYYLGQEEPFVGQGDEEYAEVEFIYHLPWGFGEKGVDHTLHPVNKVEDLKPITSWNPKKSGLTTLSLLPFYQGRDLGDNNDLQQHDHAAGVRIKYNYDNRNARFIANSGSNTSFRLSHDWGNERRPRWTTWEFEHSQYFDLGASKLTKQQALVFNAYTADTPTWNDYDDGLESRPPDFVGITLGGWTRLRGYARSRFYGRSAMSYSLEYRMLPAWQPLPEIPMVNRYDLPWWQWALFVDAGQVANSYSLKQLHTDMYTSVGASIRLNIEGIVARAEVATGEEGSRVLFYINQPF